MILIVISTADVRNAVRANVTRTVTSDTDLTPVATRARVSSAGTNYDPASVSVCLSVTCRGYIGMAERIELVFGTEASFHLSYSY